MRKSSANTLPALGTALVLASLAGHAAADCTGTTTVNCSTAGGTHTSTVGAGPGSPSGMTVDVGPGAQINTVEAPAISLGDGSTIHIRSGAVVQTRAEPGPNNGNYGSGANTIEFNSGNTLTIEEGAQVLATGTATNGEAINAMGSNNLIQNGGYVRSGPNGAAIWFNAPSGNNTVVNTATGVIDSQGGAGTIMGYEGAQMAVDFTNQGKLLGSLAFGDGNDALRVYTGSSISGNVVGGGGNNLLTLNGTGTDTYATPTTGFQTLLKNDSGTWTLGQSLAGIGVTTARVAGGTLILGTDNSAYTGSMAVDAPGVLQTSGQFAPQAIANDGLVRFAQPDDTTYAGLVSGSGGIEKTGAGTLTLSADQAFTGTTTISQGTLQLGNGGTAGSVQGNIVDNGTLAIDRSDTLTLAGTISGSGKLVQAGSGTTVLTADNSYTGGTTISAGTLQLGNGGTTGGIVGDVANNGALVIDRSNALRLDGVISGSGNLTQRGSGTTTLGGLNTYAGPTQVAAGTLAAGAANAFSPNSAHSVAAGATLDTRGFDQRVAALSNAGTVNLLSGSAGSTLTVTGPYVGHNGVLRLGTVLGDSNSRSDRLVLDGPGASASGRTSVQITNLGGLGARTLGNGIEVIGARNGATTTAQTTKDAFALAGGHVDAGAYEYRLFAGDANGAGESWYLRSEIVPPPPQPPITPEEPTTGEPSRPPAPPQPTVPMYRAEVPIFAALPAQIRQGDLAMLGNLHRRVGDEAAAPQPGGDAGVQRRAWGRLIYNDLKIQQGGVAAARSDGRQSGLQTGVDLLATSAWRAGVYVGYLDGRADVQGNARGIYGRVGRNSTRSHYLGGYATWTDASGFYVDSVLQAGRHSYTVQPDFNPHVSGKARSMTASVEIGAPFALSDNWTIEPQAQLIYQKSRFDDVQILGALVQQNAQGGWLGRIGVRVKGDLATRAGQLQPYARLNIYRGRAGTDMARFIGPAGFTDIGTPSGYTSAELAGGFTLKLNPSVSLYGELGRLFNMGGSTRVKSGIQGSAGVKVYW